MMILALKSDCSLQIAMDLRRVDEAQFQAAIGSVGMSIKTKAGD